MGQRFFLPLLIRLAVVAAGPFAVGTWLAGLAVGAGGAALLVVLELWRIDRTVRTGAEERVRFTPTPVGDLGWIDETGIRDALRDLRLLGFQPIADCTYEVPVLPPGFTRILIHRPQRVYACVAQGRRGTHAPEGVSVMLFSALVDERTLTTTSSQPSPTMAFGVERTDSWQIRPGATVHELVVEHLATRERIRAAQNVQIAGNGSVDDFVRAQEALYRRQAQECRMNGALGALRRGLRWERTPRKSWIEGVFSSRQPLIAPPMRTNEPIPVSAPSPTPPAPRPATNATAAPKPPPDAPRVEQPTSDPITRPARSAGARPERTHPTAPPAGGAQPEPRRPRPTGTTAAAPVRPPEASSNRPPSSSTRERTSAAPAGQPVRRAMKHPPRPEQTAPDAAPPALPAARRPVGETPKSAAPGAADADTGRKQVTRT